MLKDELEGNSLLNTLLNTYSVKEISNLFTQIDNNLMSLHNCSANDFLKLNSSFKEIFNQSKQISKNVNDIIDDFDSSRNELLIKEIENYMKINYHFLMNSLRNFQIISGTYSFQ